MAFTVGMKVVCVDDGAITSGIWGFDKPKLGSVYTIVKVSNPKIRPEPHIELAEIKNAKQFDFGFRASRFRPVVERKTDISIFKAMLKPTEVNA